MKHVHVAVAVIRRQGRILIARRPDHVHQGGLLEFPGGKVEPGETVQQALVRELAEETGLQVPLDSLTPVIGIRHDYGDKRVFLDVWESLVAKGEPEGREGQPLHWLTPESLRDEDFPAANRPIIRAIRLPRRLCITPPSVTPAGLEQALGQFRPELMLLRLPALARDAYAGVAYQAQSLCRHHGTGLLLHGDPTLLDAVPGAAGVHLPWHLAKDRTRRPVSGDVLLGVSCHDWSQIEQAERLQADYITLGPVNATPTHPGAAVLGWQGFSEMVAMATVPVYALGGVFETDLHRALERGAQGIAGIRFWMPG